MPRIRMLPTLTVSASGLALILCLPGCGGGGGGGGGEFSQEFEKPAEAVAPVEDAGVQALDPRDRRNEP